MAERELGLFKRFHVRTTALFAVPALALLTVLGVVSYRFAVRAEIEVLRERIRGIAVGLARGIDARDVEALSGPEDTGLPAHRRLVERFARVARAEPEVKSLYVFRPSDEPAILVFAADWVRRGTPGEIGERYDARQTDHMLDAFDAPVVEARIYSDAWGRNLSGYAPIRDERGRVVAIIGCDMSAGRVDALERRALIAVLSLYGFALLAFALGGALLGRSLRRPIQRIGDATAAIAAGRLDARVGIDRKDELGLVAKRIDAMAERLEERDRMRAIFGRYLSEDVAREVLSAQGVRSEERTVSVLFIDIRRYSTISETLSPVEVLELLNAYLAAMTDLVDMHDGCVIELLGDGILAVFGAPRRIEAHPELAVRCALAMRSKLEELNASWDQSGLSELWRERGIARLEARIGVHTGPVVAGQLGGRARAKYAVIGRAVNLAVQLESLNEELGTVILISDATRARLPAELAEAAETKGAFPVPGSDEPMAICSI